MIKRLKSIFDLNKTQVSKTDKTLKQIKELAPKVEKMSYSEMKTRVSEMRKELEPLLKMVPEEAKLSVRKVDRLKSLPDYEKDIQNKLMEFLPEIYAFMNEVYKRKLNFTYHDVQLTAGIILAQGQRLVELYTGEGKTMTFQLPLALYALAGRGAHLVTVNDYLSKRDGEYAGHILTELGLSVGVVTSTGNFKFVSDEEIKTFKGDEGVELRKNMKLQINNMDGINLIEVDKKDSYNCDITYGTNNEFGFDYLRDNMTWDLESVAQRELYFCIIDEADSILIDEARTPLIISGVPTDADTKRYMEFAAAVKDLEEDKDYVIDHKSRTVNLTEEGIVRVESNLGIDNLWVDYSTAYHIENALKAKAMFVRDDKYLVKNGEVLIVDEFTGRVLKGRRYSEGLHQAIEAKEGVEIKQESKTFATITFQNFFRIYKVLCGGSGTVLTEAEEFYKIYGLESVAIPTNKPVIREDAPDQIYKTQNGKFKAVVEEIKTRHQKGQPVLVGTVSVDRSELLSKLLDEAGIKHEVLNAKYHEQEAKIIAQAGRKGAVTVATNMAGRGADIVIGGGTRGDDAWKEIADLGGLHVIGTERHEARRIDNQLRGRTGRQGEPGSSRFYVALDDQLMRVLGGEIMTRLMNMVGLQEDMPIELKMISRQIESAQKRIEGMNFDARKRVVDYDDVMNQHREIFYSRRRNLLKLSEEAGLKVEEHGDVINLNLPENKSKLKDYEARIEESKRRLEDTVKKIIFRRLDSKILNFYAENSKVNEKNIEELGKIIAEYLPERFVAKELGVREGEASEKLKNELLSKKNVNEVRDFGEDILNKVFKDKLEEYGEDFYYLSKVLILQGMDNMWIDHLELMKDIREGINLQAYAQKDPLVEYKNEAFVIFDSFIQKIDEEVAKKVLRLQKVNQQEQRIAAQPLITNTDEIDEVSTGSREFVQGASQQSSESLNASTVISRALREKERNKMGVGNRNESFETNKNITSLKQYGRNDKVTVKYSDGRIEKDIKYKKVEADLMSGLCVIV